MYFKKNWGSMVEKEPPLGRIDMFQTSPKKTEMISTIRANCGNR